MAAIPVGEAALAGFDVIRRKPGAVLAWGGVFFVYLLVIMAFMFASVSSVAGLEIEGGEPDLAAVIGMQMMLMGVQFVITAASFVVRVVLTCAVYRAVLEPEDSRTAYMRLGKIELLVGLVTLCVGIIVGMLIFGAAFIGAGVTIAAWFASRPLAVLLGVALLIGFVALLAWVGLRMAMAVPMTFAERRIRIFEAWDLTRGHVGELFLMMLIVIAVVIAIEAVVVFAGVLAIVAAVGAGGMMDLSALSTLDGPALMARLAAFTPLFLLCGVVLAILSAVVHTIVVAPWAVAYRAIAPVGESPA
ncbi:MAG TPA: hypothetical protein VF122_02745 [Caulobacteraceae bacterium]